MALAKSGIQIIQLHEYPHINSQRRFARVREGEGQHIFSPDGVPAIPLMYVLAGQKA